MRIEEVIALALDNQFETIRQRLNIYNGSVSSQATIDQVIDAIQLLEQRNDWQGIRYVFDVPINWNILPASAIQQVSALIPPQRREGNGTGSAPSWLDSLITAIGSAAPAIINLFDDSPAPPPGVGGNTNNNTSNGNNSNMTNQTDLTPVYWALGILGGLIVIGGLVALFRSAPKKG
jgi:hypothetical protein